MIYQCCIRTGICEISLVCTYVNLPESSFSSSDSEYTLFNVNYINAPNSILSTLTVVGYQFKSPSNHYHYSNFYRIYIQTRTPRRQ